MVERIRALLMLRQISPTQFADLIQVGRPIISHILSGRNKASLEVVQRIVAAFPEVALPWLLSGNGPMLTTSEQNVTGSETAIKVESENSADVPLAADAISPEATRVAALARDTDNSLKDNARPPDTKFTANGSSKTLGLGSSTSRPAVKQSDSALCSTTPDRRQPQKFSVGATNRQPNSYKEQLPLESVLKGSGAAASSGGSTANAQASSPVISGGIENEPMLINKATATIGVGAANSQHPPYSMPIVADPTGSVPVSPAVKPAAHWTDPGKSIRRIVLFYHDGSFSDFQPES